KGNINNKEDFKEALNEALKEALSPSIIMIGFFLGLFHTTNFWDLPIYFVVSGAIILFSNLIVYKFKSKSLLITAFQAIVIIVIITILAFPFTLNFDRISAKPILVENVSPFYQLIVLWGLPIFTETTFLIITIIDYVDKKNGPGVSYKKRKKSN